MSRPFQRTDDVQCRPEVEMLFCFAYSFPRFVFSRLRHHTRMDDCSIAVALYDIPLLFRRQTFPHVFDLLNLIGSEVPSSHHLLARFWYLPNPHSVSDPTTGASQLLLNIKIRMKIESVNEVTLRKMPQQVLCSNRIAQADFLFV